MIFRLPFPKALHVWAFSLLVVTVLNGQDSGPPDGYYDSASGLLGDSLKDSLHDIIDNHTVRSYDDFKLAGRTLDEDPDVPGNIILLYSGESFPGNLFGTSGEVWNREHVWPQSYGVDDSDPDFNTVGHSDFHHLFPALAAVNSTRSNKFFDWTDNTGSSDPNAPDSTYDSNSYEPRDEDKGRVARAILYMATRYEGLSDEKRVSSGITPPDLKLSDRANSGSETMAKLSTLLEWNRMFSPDPREQLRNDRIYYGFMFSTRTYRQGNRNPFADHPEFGDAIYTADQFVSYGSWRLTHFNPEELYDEALTGDSADPDGDRIPNLIELAINGDPLADSGSIPLQVELLQAGGGEATATLRHIQLKQADKSGITYHLESSTDPWIPTSWAPVILSPATQSLDTFTEEATYTVPLGEEVRHFRLRIGRSLPLDSPGVAAFDPARFSAQPGSLFAYDPEPVEDWRLSDWFAPVYEPTAGWVYQKTHHWIHLSGDNPRAIWLYDDRLGWFWTSHTLYPICFSAGRSEWVVFDPGTAEPNRSLTLLASGLQIHEGEF